MNNKDLLLVEATILIIIANLKLAYSVDELSLKLLSQLCNETFLVEKLNNDDDELCLLRVKLSSKRQNLNEFHFKKSEFLELTQNCTKLRQILNQIDKCDQISLNLVSISTQTTKSSSSYSTFLSSKTQLLFYLLLFMVMFAFVCICIYLIKTSSYSRRKKLKNSSQTNYFNPFDIIKIGDQPTQNKNISTNCNNLENGIKNESSMELLQPSTQDLSSGDLRIDVFVESSEGDTRSEYSITDNERMKYVREWLESLSY